jgi:hypothetical protein
MTTCLPGYTLIDGECKLNSDVQNIPNCTIYNTDGTCSTCLPGYTLIDGECKLNSDVQNIPNCSTYNTDGTCSTCLPGYKLINGQCGLDMNPIPCFTAGSMILTPNGYKKVEDFKNGDLIQTHDHRSVPVQTKITLVTVTTKENAPYLIPKGSLGHGIPKQDLRLSPNHAIRISKGVWVIPRLAKDIFKQIKQYDVGKPITYYHLETPNFYKDHLVCNESIVESYAGKQMESVKQELYYQKNLYAHYLSGLSSEEDNKEQFTEKQTLELDSGNYMYVIREKKNYYL